MEAEEKSNVQMTLTPDTCPAKVMKTSALIPPLHFLQPTFDLCFLNTAFRRFMETYARSYCGTGCPPCCRVNSIFPSFLPYKPAPLETAKCASKLSTLHLRKAKLMFFYVRYPTSSLLKSYFPDVSFDKKNTAQLVKWFSNFREYFYTKIEKHVRCENNALEMYQNICSHYNRYKHFKPPENFRKMINATVELFTEAIQKVRDSESSWKKTIYKIVAKLDEPASLPTDFKQEKFPIGFYEAL